MHTYAHTCTYAHTHSQKKSKKQKKTIRFKNINRSVFLSFKWKEKIKSFHVLNMKGHLDIIHRSELNLIRFTGQKHFEIYFQILKICACLKIDSREENIFGSLLKMKIFLSIRAVYAWRAKAFWPSFFLSGIKIRTEAATNSGKNAGKIRKDERLGDRSSKNRRVGRKTDKEI